MSETYNAAYYKQNLNLEKHPEGGFFSQTYVDADGKYSSIYFLLETGEVSHMHQLEEDELWYFHAGSALNIYEIDGSGALHITELGPDAEKGEVLQYLVKKGSIFGAAMKNEGYSLVGCMVAPAFTYEHFKLFSREELLEKYPQYEEVIHLLT